MSNYNKKKGISLSAVIAIILAILLVVGAIFGVGYNLGWFNKSDDTDKTEQTEEASTEESTASKTVSGVSLRSSGTAQLTATTLTATAGVSKTITATVSPSTAENQNVDWSLEWADGAALSSSTISDYATVTPASDGSTTATLDFYKSFLGSDMILTVTTREGGFVDTCIVRYSGIPTSMTIDCIGEEVGVNNTYDFDITMSAPLGVVGDSYCDYSVTSVSSIWSIVVDDYSINTVVSGSSVTQNKTWAGSESTITVNSIMDDLVSVSISDGKLHIEPKMTIESYYSSISGSSASNTNFTTTYNDMFKSYKDISGVSSDYYGQITVTVKENVSGVTGTATFYIVQTVTGVSLSANLIEI